MDENKRSTEEEVPDVGYRRSVSSVEANSPSLLDSTASETKSLTSPYSDKDEGGMSETIFSPSLLNSGGRTLQHSTQMDLLKGDVTSHSELDSPSAISHTDVSSSDVSPSDRVTRSGRCADGTPPGMEVPPSDTQYLVQSMNTFPMSPEIGMGSRKDLSISLDETKDFPFEGRHEDETAHQSTHLEDDTKRVHHMQPRSTGVNNRAGAALLLREEERMSRTKQLALKKGQPTRKTRQRTLKNFLAVARGKVGPELCGDESAVKGEEGVEKSAQKDALSSTTSSYLPAQGTASQEEIQPSNLPSPRKMQAIPKTTSSPIAPRYCKVVTVVPQTPLPFTSPSSSSKSSPREWSQQTKEEGPNARPPKWDPEETYLPFSQLDHSDSHDRVGELANHSNGVEQGKPHSPSRRVGGEHFRFSTRPSSASEFSTKSDYPSVPQAAPETCISATTVANTNGVDSRRKRACDDGNYYSSVNDSRPPPVKRHAVDAQEDVDHPR